MAERDGYIPGVPCWIDTSQPDPDAAAAFYGGLFGWDFENAMPSGSEAKYLVARIRGGDVAAISSQTKSGSPAAWDTYVWVESADEAAARVRTAGGTVVTEPLDVFDAGRTAVFTDSEGAVFCVWAATAPVHAVRGSRMKTSDRACIGGSLSSGSEAQDSSPSHRGQLPPSLRAM